MANIIPTYSHPYRAKIVMLKGQKGETPTVDITSTDEGVVISATNPNDGDPVTTSATIVRPRVEVEETETGATLTAIDTAGSTSANIRNGTSVASASMDDSHHLRLTLSNGTTIDAGEIPLNAFRVAYTTTIDGTTNNVPLPAGLDASLVSYILINGLIYSDGWTINNNVLTLSFTADHIPSGKLEVIQNAAGYLTDGNMAALSDAEIIAITV